VNSAAGGFLDFRGRRRPILAQRAGPLQTSRSQEL
jgi:hypothetical protein